jgi:hypothetical protein
MRVEGALAVAMALKTNSTLKFLSPLSPITIEKIRFQNLLSQDVLSSLPQGSNVTSDQWFLTLNDFAETRKEDMKGRVDSS